MKPSRLLLLLALVVNVCAAPAVLEWQPQPGVSRWVVRVGGAFSDVSQTLYPLVERAQMDLPAGLYYAAVSGVTPQGIEGPPAFLLFEVQAAPDPRVTLTIESSTNLSQWTPRHSITLAGDPAGECYRLKISTP